MRRDIIATVFLAILAIGLVPMAAFADDAASATADAQATATATTTSISTDADTQAQVKDMDNGPGAQVRLLQLERAVTRAQLQGQQVIDALHAQNISNTTDLEAIEAEFSVMITQIQTAEQNANNTDNATQVFVSVKTDAKDLVKRFHDAAAPLLKESDKKQLRDDVQKIDKDDLKDITDRIENERHAANTLRVEATFQDAGFTPSATLLASLNAGTATVGDVQKELRAQLATLSMSQRKEAGDKLRDDAAKHRVAALAEIEKVEANIGDRETRLQDRISIAMTGNLTMAANRLGMVLSRVENRGEKVDQREGRVQNRTDAAAANQQARDERAANRSPGMMPGLRIRGSGDATVNDDNSGTSADANTQTEVAVQ